MGRGKLRLQLISNEKARRRGFEKRKKGLEKAAQELSTLCGVEIGMIIHAPPHGMDSDQVTIWPRNEVVKGLIESYNSRLGYDGQNKTYNLSDFFKDQTEKVEGELEKLRQKTREVKYPISDNKFNCMSLEELRQFHGGLMAKIDNVRGRINLMKGSTSLYTESDVLMNHYPVQERGVFEPYEQAVQESGFFEPSMWNYDPRVQESGVFEPNMWRKYEQLVQASGVFEPSIYDQPVQETGVFEPSMWTVQESGVFEPSMWEEQPIQESGFEPSMWKYDEQPIEESGGFGLWKYELS